MTASVGRAMAGSWVVGSMTRSGRSTTQTQATTSTTRATAARPAQPASSRSSHPAGLSPWPNDSPLTAALSATTYSSVPINVSSHTERRKRTARMYSGPSGQAATIRTRDPNSTASPNVDSVRPSQVAPSETVEASTTTSSVVVVLSSVSGAAVPVSPGTVVAVVDTGDVRISKLNRPEAPGSPDGWLTDHATLHVPAGIGSRMSTVSVRLSALRVGGWLRAVNGLLLQATVIWLALPTSPSNVRTSCVGGVSSSAPSAGWLSTSEDSWAPAGPPPRIATPTSAARIATTSRIVRPGTPVRADTPRTVLAGLARQKPPRRAVPAGRSHRSR